MDEWSVCLRNILSNIAVQGQDKSISKGYKSEYDRAYTSVSLAEMPRLLAESPG